MEMTLIIKTHKSIGICYRNGLFSRISNDSNCVETNEIAFLLTAHSTYYAVSDDFVSIFRSTIFFLSTSLDCFHRSVQSEIHWKSTNHQIQIVFFFSAKKRNDKFLCVFIFIILWKFNVVWYDRETAFDFCIKGWKIRHSEYSEIR